MTTVARLLADRQPDVAAGAQIVALAMLSATVGLGVVGWTAGLVHAGGLWLLLSAAVRRHGVRSLGPAGAVTCARGVLVGAVAALVAGGLAHPPAPAGLLVVIATVALVLDAVDGRVARRTGTSTPLGARFDMELDAWLILVLTVHVAGILGWWVLGIGAMRYAFVVVAALVGWMRSRCRPGIPRGWWPQSRASCWSRSAPGNCPTVRRLRWSPPRWPRWPGRSAATCGGCGTPGATT
jgi:phosphatidylglycerophosphate synthase